MITLCTYRLYKGLHKHWLQLLSFDFEYTLTVLGCSDSSHWSEIKKKPWTLCWDSPRIVLTSSLFVSVIPQFTKGRKETRKCPQEPAGQMCPHWGKVLRRSTWTGEKVRSSLPAPLRQSTSFIHFLYCDFQYWRCFCSYNDFEHLFVIEAYFCLAKIILCVVFVHCCFSKYGWRYCHYN